MDSRLCKRIAERWALYREGLQQGGHSEARCAELLAKSALWRNVFVAESDAQAEDGLSTALLRTREHMMYVRNNYNPDDFVIEAEMLNPWSDPAVNDAEALEFVLRTGSIYGSAERVREQVAELRDAGVGHLLCQTGFGDMSQEQNLDSMRRFATQVMPAFSSMS